MLMVGIKLKRENELCDENASLIREPKALLMLRGKLCFVVISNGRLLI